MLRDRDYQAGREIDALIHKEVFGREDEPLPYSTNVDAADLLVKRFDLQVMPVFELTPSLAPDHLERDLETGRYKQEPLEYSVISLEDENGEKLVRHFPLRPHPHLRSAARYWSLPATLKRPGFHSIYSVTAPVE